MKKVITVVGVGALGSHVVMLLRNMDVEIRVIDFDRTEQKNVLSQFHGKPSVGKLKTDSLKQTMQFLWGSKLTTFSSKLVENNAKELLGGSDLIIDCLDNGAAREVVQKFVRAASIACLHGALSANGDFGRAIWDEEFVIDTESATGAATCENGEHLPFIGLTAAVIAKSAQLFLTKGKKTSYQVSPAGTSRV
jgi:predicted ThiF/HesA family dinucleotide-utilizing enzyme